MRTEKLELAVGCYEKSIKKAAEILKKGGTVAIPTETVYGLAANAFNENAITKIFSAKGRPQDNPLIVHIADIQDLKQVAKDIPDVGMRCAKAFWPGPLTMVFSRADGVAVSVSAGLDTVAVRMPSHPVARDIIRLSGPLAAPSANLSGSPSPTKPEHVIADLDGKIDAVVMSDDCGIGVESTVISFCVSPPRLLRPGAVTPEQLREIIPELEIDQAVFAELQENEKVTSPGMKYKHYAPETETFLVEGSTDAFADFVNKKPDSVAVCFSEDIDKINIKTVCYGSGEDEMTLAHEVFSVLREVDELKAKAVYIHAPSKTGVGLAVYNRLIRAAAFKVIQL